MIHLDLTMHLNTTDTTEYLELLYLQTQGDLELPSVARTTQDMVMATLMRLLTMADLEEQLEVQEVFTMDV